MTITNAEREVSLRHYLRILRKHRWLIFGIFVLTASAGTIWTFIQVPIYQATATVLIDPEPPKVMMNIQDVAPMGATSSDYYQTQYELMKSRSVIEAVLQSGVLKQSAGPGSYGALTSGLRIEPKRNTRLVSVKFESPDPAMAAAAANALAHGYAKYNLDLKLKGARDALGWLAEQMKELKTKVEDSSVALQNYRVKAGILGMQEQRQITAQKIMDFNRAYLESQAQRLTIEAKLRELMLIAKDRSGAQTIFTVADNALIQKLKGESADLETQRSRLLKTFKDKHPEVLKVDAALQQVNLKIDTEIQTMLRAVQTEYRVAKAREDTLLNNVNQLRREGQDLNEKEIQYLTLQRENESNQQLYDAVLKRLKETGMTGGLETNNVRVVEEAQRPGTPVRPRKVVSMVLSIAVGLLLGVGTAVTLEYFDTTVKSPEEVERYLGIPVIGVVPVFGGRR